MKHALKTTSALALVLAFAAPHMAKAQSNTAEITPKMAEQQILDLARAEKLECLPGKVKPKKKPKEIVAADLPDKMMEKVVTCVRTSVEDGALDQAVFEAELSEPAQVMVMAGDMPTDTTAEATTEAVETAAEEVSEAAEETAEATTEAVEDAAEETAEASEAVTETAEQAVEETAEAADDAAEAVEEAAEETANAAEEGTETTEQAVETAAEETAETEEQAGAATEPLEPKTEAVTQNAEAETTETTQQAAAPKDDTADAPEKPAKKKAAKKAKKKDKKAAKKKLEARQEDTAESTQAANKTPEAKAAKAEPAPEAEVKTETVTKETTRQSSEEFDKAEAPAATTEEGLSNFEKFALGAAGIGILAAILESEDKEVVSTSKDRVVVSRGEGDYYILKDDNALLRQPGSTVETVAFDDGSTRQVITLEDGTRIITIRAANGQVLSRRTELPGGRTVELFDDTEVSEPVDLESLPEASGETISVAELNNADLRAAIEAERLKRLDRRFSLQQVREIRAVRELMPVIELSNITFETGSAVIRVDQAEALTDIGQAMGNLIAENPGEVFLVEGHTDAVGSASSNLALSDRRAESVALALTEYFNVPPQNLVVQGYGEANLKVPTPDAEEANRRAAVRRITPLLQASIAN